MNERKADIHDTIVQKYLLQLPYDANQLVTYEEANDLMVNHVVSVFKRRIRLTEKREYTIRELAKMLAYVEEQVGNAISKACQDEFED
ncbi:hypothetical protein [Exiguobacterium sp. s163]|uniref:hypothetical protein n=1 Tax=Exiguobacterium sp. s163 TaxID=2751287 RepID=UPI001BEC6140|nr:hypothetical protein [Exiguobacterium sp. s163]